MTFRKVTATAWIVNEKKFWQVPMAPWHMSSYFWPFFGVIWSIFSVKNQFSHIFPAPGGSPHQSLFYFIPQEKRLIRRPCWGWKNMGESILHWEDGPTDTKKTAKSRRTHAKEPWELVRLCFRSLFWTNESPCDLSYAITQLKLSVLSLVQTTVGFGNMWKWTPWIGSAPIWTDPNWTTPNLTTPN